MERQEVAELVATLVQQSNAALMHQLTEQFASLKAGAQAVQSSSSSTSPGQLSGPDNDRVTHPTPGRGRQGSRSPERAEADWMDEEEDWEEYDDERDVPTFGDGHRAW